MIIIDSNIWIDFFKNIENKETKELSYLLKNKIEVGANSLIVIEVIQSLTDDKEYQQIKHILNTFKIYKISDDIVMNAGDIFRACQKGNKEKNISGKTLKTTDCIIAAQCIKDNVSIFSRDQHFKMIADIISDLKIYKGEKK
jgi:predicted nucleic acid-binding protein